MVYSLSPSLLSSQKHFLREKKNEIKYFYKIFIALHFTDKTWFNMQLAILCPNDTKFNQLNQFPVSLSFVLHDITENLHINLEFNV